MLLISRAAAWWAAASCCLLLSLAVAAPTMPDELIPATVVRVVDGDTIVVRVDSKDERVRLIGVDTPETVHPTLGVEPYGPEASAYTKEQLEGLSVHLELDVQERDVFGRILAYVWVDGELYNLQLVAEGFAVLLTIPPNVRYAELFQAAQGRAREAGAGLWSPEVYDARCVDLNSASLEDLQRIINIGPERANAIITRRPWASVRSLTSIRGIGDVRIGEIDLQGLACVR